MAKVLNNTVAMSVLEIIQKNISILYDLKEGRKVIKCKECSDCKLYACPAYYDAALDTAIEDLQILRN